MNYREFRPSILVFGLVLLGTGISILWRGRIWSLMLADERYIVGALPILAGIYVIYLSLSKKR